MINNSNINPQISLAQPVLDEASKTVGVDINKYVFGEDKFDGNVSSRPININKPNTGKVLKGGLIYALITGIGISLFHRFKGKGLKPDGFLSSFMKLFKK